MKLYSAIAFGFALVCATGVHAGSITGTVKYEGEIPKLKEIKMSADPICLSHHSEAVYAQKLVLGEGNTLGNVFVQVVNGVPKKAYAAPAEAHIMNQKGCMYTPHVSGVMVGQEVKFLNPDGTLHNVHAVPKINEEFNLAMPKFRTEISRTFTKPEFMFPIKCDVHPWMEAYLTVMEHPFFSATTETGLFEIKDLPAGDYEIEAWHEKLGTQTLKVTVSDAAPTVLDITFSRPESK